MEKKLMKASGSKSCGQPLLSLVLSAPGGQATTGSIMVRRLQNLFDVTMQLASRTEKPGVASDFPLGQHGQRVTIELSKSCGWLVLCRTASVQACNGEGLWTVHDFRMTLSLKHCCRRTKLLHVSPESVGIACCNAS